jgi:hypothetical protein
VLHAIGTKPLSRAPRGVLAAGAAAVSRAFARRFAEDIIRYADAAELVILPAHRACAWAGKPRPREARRQGLVTLISFVTP